MTERFKVSVVQVDFGREVEIRVTDRENPSRKMSMRIAEMQIPDVEEMLQAILDQLAVSKQRRKDLAPDKRLLEAFREGVEGARGEDDQPT